MARSTIEELDGQPWGAVGTFGPVALQAGLNKIRQPEEYFSSGELTADLVPGEVAFGFVNGVPTLAAKNGDGTAYTGTFQAPPTTDLAFVADTQGYKRIEVTSVSPAGLPLTINVIWPDGNPGVLTATADPVWTRAVRSYVVTYGNPVIKTLTQPPITRSSLDGRGTLKPPIVIT